MSLSVYATLLATLQASVQLSGVAVSFGEEFIAGADRMPPRIDVVPVGGPWSDCGYAQGTDPDLGANPTPTTQEQFDVYCYGYDTTDGATAVNHADATLWIATQVMRAFYAQPATGLYVKPISGRWVPAQNEISRFGRVYVLSFRVDITVPGDSPVEALVTSVEVNVTA